MTRVVARGSALIVLGASLANAQAVDGGIATRVRPSADDATRIETHLRGAFRPTFGAGFGLLLQGDAGSVTRFGERVALRSDVRAGPRVAYHGAELAFVGGGARLEGARAANTTRSVGGLLALRFDRAKLALTSEQTSFAGPRLMTYDTTYVVAGFPFLSSRTRLERARLSYSQVSGEVSWTAGRVTSTASAGARAGNAAARERWGSVGAMVALVRGASLHLEAGRIASLPEQYLPGTRYASVSLRFAGHRRASPEADSVVPRVSLLRDSVGVSGLRIVGVRGSQVELMSDATNWAPVDLRASGENAWTLEWRLPVGVHRVLMRVDGRAWEPPPDLPTSSSEYGGRVGVLLVR
jgi:hypothetical protein